MTFTVHNQQIAELNNGRSLMVVKNIMDFLLENEKHLAERNIPLIEESTINNILGVAQKNELKTRGAAKSLALLIFKYSSPSDYLSDEAFTEDLSKTGISPEIRIMNIHDALKFRSLRNTL